MVPGIERVNALAPRGPLVIGMINLGGIGFFLSSIHAFTGMEFDRIAAILVLSWLPGLLIGAFVKYRSDFAVRFCLAFSVYIAIVLCLLFGGATIITSAEFFGFGNQKWWLLAAYQIGIILSVMIGFLLQVQRMGSLDSLAWGNRVDLDKYTAKPDIYAIKNTRSLFAVTSIATVSISLCFLIFTGSRDNAIYIAAPLLIIGFIYVCGKHIGPQLSDLYQLRQYEKQTGRRFINADYEKIQELRRTFFLSRWLMKDYRPAAKQ